MSDLAPSTPEAQQGVLIPALSRLGFPALLFGATFLVLMVGVSALVTPDRFPVRIDGGVVRIGDLQAERDRLLSEQSRLVQERRELQQRAVAPVLHLLQTQQLDTRPIGQLLLSLVDLRRVWQEQSDQRSLTLTQTSYRDGVLVLQGSIQDRQGQSIQGLASFVDALRSLPGVRAVTEPEYVALPLSTGGTHSEFTLRLSLADA